jgi:hypothetical protein
MPDRHKRPKEKPELTDEEVRAILVRSMADVGADPALVYAFQKNGVYVCEENERRSPKVKLKAFERGGRIFRRVEGSASIALSCPALNPHILLIHSRCTDLCCTVPAPQSQHEKRALALLMSGAVGPVKPAASRSKGCGTDHPAAGRKD